MDIVNGRFSWGHTPTLRLVLECVHPELKLDHFMHYIAVGQCATLPAVSALPGHHAQISLMASDSRIEGCLLFRIKRSGSARSITKNLYALLVCKIVLGGDARAGLSLIESPARGFFWTSKHLAAHYRGHVDGILKEFESTDALTYAWSLDVITDFMINVTRGDADVDIIRVTVETKDASASLTKQPTLMATEQYAVGMALSDSVAVTSYISFRQQWIQVAAKLNRLLLLHGEVGMFEGRCISGALDNIMPKSHSKVVLKANSVARGKTRGCLLYELVTTDEHPFSGSGEPVILGRRTFLAIDVCIVPNDAASRKIAVEIITVKSANFPACPGDAFRCAHEKVLHHFMQTFGWSSKVHLDKINLKLSVAFNPGVRHGIQQNPQASDSYRTLTVENRTSAEDQPFIVCPLLPTASTLEHLVPSGESEPIRAGQARHYSQSFTTPFYQIYAITRNEHDEAAFGCLLVLSRGYGDKEQEAAYSYKAAVLYTPLHGRSSRAIGALVKRYLGYARTNGEYRFSCAQLMDREIWLPGSDQAHLAVYQAIDPSYLLTILLRDSFDATRLYDKPFYKDELGVIPRPYRIRVSIRSKQHAPNLALIDYIANGVPLSNMAFNEPLHSHPTSIEFRLPGEDFRHAILLRYRIADVDVGFDVHVNLAILDSDCTGDHRRELSTSIRYVDTSNMTGHQRSLECVYLHTKYVRVIGNQFGPSTMPATTSAGETMVGVGDDTIVQEVSAHSDVSTHNVAVCHFCRDNDPFSFEVTIDTA
ncbi:hypothetical protein THASP1DRAFT_26322 [Thamnocephalis sphaerospora]|uniref:Uncharacterized protein n=1 Tax=Thamnocephalis sphaerospora TaxID=78915 RepID=A0A4P9XIV7_9FUNG|nr:hypothetical protein THASP1DRAFT_26322 [Thamnocephalis sphaerospora]|eukprot:RKP05130.1 hypothetical protein THASP1DRAFT_26322 [Thamnocephalis sphaerospora]